MLKPSKTSLRGVALLTAVMFAVLLGVVARGIMVLTLGAHSQRAVYQKRANQAAQAGLEYAKTRLAEDPSWKGDDPSGTTISTDEFVVMESNGNVYGKLSYTDGSQARFHLRFNYQDGSGGDDGLDDPLSDAWSDSSLLSVNNLESSTKKDVPKLTKQGSVDADAPPKEIPAQAALVQIEGTAGPAVDNASFANPWALTSDFKKSSALSSVLKLVLDDPAGPAVMQAGNDVTFATKGDVNVSTSDDTTPTIRSKGEMNVAAVGPEIDFIMEDGDISEQDGSLTVSGSVNFSEDLDVSEEPASDGYTELMWEDVNKPSEDGDKLSAGVYILLPVGEASTNPKDAGLPGKAATQELVYFDMNYDEFVNVVLPQLGQPGCPTGDVMDPDFGGRFTGGVAGGLGGAGQPISYDSENNKIVVTGDLKLHPTDAGTIDFAILSGAGTQMESGDVNSIPGGAIPLKDQVRVGVEIDQAALYAEGMIAIQGAQVNVSGATLIGEQDLLLNTTALSVNQPGEQNLSLYFKGDINVSSFHGTEYGNFDLIGTIYTWSNLNFRLGDSGLTDWGNLDVTGNMVAFGGEPGVNDPGDGYNSCLGEVSIAAQTADIEYDPTAVTQILEPSSLGDGVKIAAVSTWGGE
jgi:hypothetical protein